MIKERAGWWRVPAISVLILGLMSALWANSLFSYPGPAALLQALKTNPSSQMWRATEPIALAVFAALATSCLVRGLYRLGTSRPGLTRAAYAASACGLAEALCRWYMVAVAPRETVQQVAFGLEASSLLTAVRFVGIGLTLYWGAQALMPGVPGPNFWHRYGAVVLSIAALCLCPYLGRFSDEVYYVWMALALWAVHARLSRLPRGVILKMR